MMCFFPQYMVAGRAPENSAEPQCCPFCQVAVICKQAQLWNVS